MVKRIECPANLTRVTGCKLNAQGLPAADPAAIDMASASSKGFSSGYTTTTMQDCCRPTCAYHGNVTGADGTYKQYYTCDSLRKPRVVPSSARASLDRCRLDRSVER